MKRRRKQAQSKMVKCDICGQEMRSRGLPGHLRIKHHIVVERITKVISELPTQDPVSGAGTKFNLSRTIRQTTTYKKVDVARGRFARVLTEQVMSEQYGDGPDRDMSDDMRQQRDLRFKALNERESSEMAKIKNAYAKRKK